MNTSSSAGALSRRHFLRAASIAGAAALGGRFTSRRAGAAIAPVSRAGGARLKVGLNAYSFSKPLNDHLRQRGPGMTLLELVDFCARQNFDGLDVTGYFFPSYPKPPPDELVNQIKRRAFDCGLGISGTGVRNNFTTADQAVRAASVQHIKEWIEVAARLGAPVVRVFADTQMKAQTWETVAPGCARDQVEEWIAGHLHECAEHGKKYGVVIGVQNHGDFLKTGEDHLKLVQRADSEWCGGIVDTGYYKTADPYADMAQVAPYAVNWQIKESPFGAESETRTDLARLLGIVRRAGYRGYLPIETLSAPGRDYDPFQIVPNFLGELRAAIDATASIVPPPENPAPPAVIPATAAPEPPARKPANRKPQ